ncbi:MAG: tetratricopeptide repeat protein [Planctomycetota bacterium]|nr:MAG: tetratricopeptide repeat protein [Planctomycetota bacterium]REJ92161.1 MAG: tetratricopeptide repeat protein [Planctomycetota bacterium]REK28697.1 MAG: tetratricopeptide repeat protein [Planctomycetota bacterium]REK39311.1 MAG: tetratricopeptide repeat protein [Planctomycetota bacterium]
MPRLISKRLVFGVAVTLVAMLPATAWSQHGHGAGHGFGGHGFGGHGYGGHHNYGGGHHGYGVHGGLHGYAHYGYRHYGYGHDYSHRYRLHDYRHGGYLHSYDHHDYYPHSLYHFYPYFYDDYRSYDLSSYPWYGLYGGADYLDRVVVNRSVIGGNQGRHTAQGKLYQQRAELAFRAGRYNEAVRLANHAIVEMPRDGKLLLFLSQSLFATGDYRGAAAAVHQASTMLDESDWGYVVKNWRNYYRGAAYREAMDKLNTFVKENPDAAYARFLRAYHFGFLGQEEFARKEMANAIELESRDQLAMELLSRFGGKPAVESSDAADVDRTGGASPIEEERNGEAEHDHGAHNHDAHEHGHDDHRGRE